MRYGLTTHQRKSSGLHHGTPKYTGGFRKPLLKTLNGFLILKNSPVSRAPEVSLKESKRPAYLISPRLMIDRTPDAVLAYAISIGELTYCVEGGSVILITVSDEVNIVIPESSTGTAKYVDIDIDQIQGVSSGGGPSQSQSGSSQMESLVVLTIWISNTLEESFYVNALGQNADSIHLAFTSSEAAATIQQIIASRITNCPRASQSEPVNISQHLYGEIGEPAGTVPVNRFSVDLVTAASEANALLAQNPVGHLNLTPNAEDKFGQQLEQLDQSGVEAQPSDRTILGIQESTPLVVCAMNPIDTQQFCEAVISPYAKPYFQDISNDDFQNRADRQEAGSSPGSSSVALSHRYFPTNGYNRLATNGSIEGPPVIPEEHHGSPPCHANIRVDNFSGKQPVGPGSRPDMTVEVETPRKAALLGPRRRSPRLARDGKMRLAPPSMSIPVTPASRINKRERYRGAINETPPNSLKKVSPKAIASRNRGEQLSSPKDGQKSRKDGKPLPSPISRPRRAAALSANKKIHDMIESELSETEENESVTSEGTAPVRRDHKSDRYQSPSNSSGTKEGSKRGSTSCKDKRIQPPGDKRKANRAIGFTKASSRGLGTEKAGSLDKVDPLPDQLIQEAALVSLSANNKPRLMPLDAPTNVVDRIDKVHGTMLTKTFPEPLQEEDFIQQNSILNSTLDMGGGSFLEETTDLIYNDVTSISTKLKKREIPETPAHESKHANTKDTDTRGVSTGVSIASKLQSALSSVIDIRPKAMTWEFPKLEAFQLSATIAPPSPKKAPEKKLAEPKNGDFEVNNNSEFKTRPQPLEVRPDPSNRTTLNTITFSEKTYHVKQISKDADCKPFEEFRTLDDDKENHSTKKHLKTPLDVDRKCNIISFDSKGPRNQGISSSQKPRRGLVPKSPSPELPTSVKVTGLKRKGQDDNDSEINLGSYAASPAKRPRKNTVVTRTRDGASRIVLKRDSSTKHTARKASSQSTRVDAKGSPLPFIHSSNIKLARPAIEPNHIRDADYGGQDCIVHAVNLRKPSSGFVFPQERLSPPSSQCIQAYKAPPSTVDEYTAHKLHPRGNSIDIQSHDVPQDVRPLPFVDLHTDALKNFMHMLQRSNKRPYDQDISALAATMNQDLGNTLFNTGPREVQISSSVCSRVSSSLGSSSPSSYSGDGSPSDDPSSGEGIDDAGDELATEFQPHQVKTLEVLYDISLVSQKLFVESPRLINRATTVSRAQPCLQRKSSERSCVRLPSWRQSPHRGV